MRRKWIGSVVAATLVVGSLSGCAGEEAEAAPAAAAAAPAAAPAAASAAASAPTGIQRTIVSRAAMQDGGKAGAFEPGGHTVVLKLVIPPETSVGWHAHYDGGAVIVDKGTATTYGLNGPMCEPVRVKAGEAIFVPPVPQHQHLLRNEGTEPVELTTYYWNVPPDKDAAVKAEQPSECPADLK